MADKVYEPEVIQDTPFPGEPQLVPLPGQANPAGTYSPAITKDKPFKKKIVASETVGQDLNIRSKKILQEFELQQSGGFFCDYLFLKCFIFCNGWKISTRRVS